MKLWNDLHTAPSFIRAVGTIDAAIAKVMSGQTRAITAGQLFIATVSVLQQRLWRLLICKKLVNLQILMTSISLSSPKSLKRQESP